MADFRKIFNASALVGLLAALSAPAYAASQLQCFGTPPTPPFVRSEGKTELVGELTINCTGGVSTAPGNPVPRVNIRLRLNTNITSKLLVSAAAVQQDNEILLIIDEPNSGRYFPNLMLAGETGERALLACGQTGAPDTSASGRNVCDIIAPTHPSRTYDGTPDGWAGQDNNGVTRTCDGVDPDGPLPEGPLPARPASGTFGCGRPNIFQGHYVTGFSNMVEFLGVPFDPPGDAQFNSACYAPDPALPPRNPECGTLQQSPWTRTLRFANIRTDANAFFVAGNNSSVPITAFIEVSGNTETGINQSSEFILARATSGLNAPTASGTYSFVQCVSTSLFSLEGIRNSARELGGNLPPLFIRFGEGFANSWKTKGWEQMQANSIMVSGNRVYNETFLTPTVTVLQNVPGAQSYHTESGFAAPTTGVDPSGSSGQNPPLGVGVRAVGPPFGLPANQTISNSTGITDAGVATNGTRLQILFGAVPVGVTLYTPDVVYLTHKGTNTVTGVAIRNTATDPNRFPLAPPGTPSPTDWLAVGTVVTGGLQAVYEVIYSDPFGEDELTVPIGVTTTNALPQTIDVSTTVKGGFAPSNTSGDGIPLLTSATAGQLPRFFENLQQAGAALFTITKCNCNLMFPFVSSASGFDTGVAVANTSLSPTDPTYIQTLAQSGPVQFWYFQNGALARTECTNVASKGVCPGTTFVPSGGVMTFTLARGSNTWGLCGANSNGSCAGLAATNFSGYMIAKTGFQYCHGFAYFSDLDRAVIPGIYGTSVGYLALVMDPSGSVGTVTGSFSQGAFSGNVSVTSNTPRTVNSVADGLNQ